MSASTESPFSLTIKVGPNNDLLTGRAATADEMLGRIHELRILAAAMQGVTQPAPVQRDEVAAAIDTLAAGGITGTVVPAVQDPVQGGAIEQRDDKWGNKYTRGMPDAGACAHGPRIVKNGTNKAGRPYKAYVCLNDSPFGDYKAGKCDVTWPPR